MRDIARLNVIEDDVERQPRHRSRLGLVLSSLLNRDGTHERARPRARVLDVTLGSRGGAQLDRGYAVARTADNVGVVLRDGDLRRMPESLGAHLDIQIGHALDEGDINIVLSGEQLARADDVGIGNTLERLKGGRGVTAHGAQDRSSLDPAHAARVGNRDALNVLDDVARTAHREFLGLAAEHQARKGGGIRQRNRLRASQRADEFAVQQVAQRGVAILNRHLVYALLCHGNPLVRMSDALQCSEPERLRAITNPAPSAVRQMARGR